MERLLEGKVALITGGASGIGRATAQLFAREGAHVVVADVQHDPREGGEPTHELAAQNEGVQSKYIRCDVTSAEDRQAAVDACDEFGGIDILLNNAGIFRQHEFLDVTEQDYDQMMEINVKAVFFMAQAAARKMVQKGWGNIIMLSSVAGMQGSGPSALYNSTKGAVRLLSYALADALGPRGIRVNSLHPGVIETTMTTVDVPLIQSERGQTLLKTLPSRRLGTPQDIAKAALFLASDLSDYVNGSSLRIDGGMLRV